MKNKGFTLIELLAVIVILGFLITMASVNIAKYINSSKEKAASISKEDLEDAAITYGLDKLTILDNCALTSLPTSTKPTMPSSDCKANTVTVKYLKTEGFFSDPKGVCDENGSVLVYKYKHVEDSKAYYDIKAYV